MNPRILLGLALSASCLFVAPRDGHLRAVAHAQPSSERAVEVTFIIRGMVTSSCPVLVEAAVRRIEGVISVEADLSARRATVRYLPSKTSPARIRDVIRDQAGFEADAVRP